MRLGLKWLKDVGSNANLWSYASSPPEFYEKTPQTLTFQVTDESADRRYMPAAGATLQVTLDSVDSAKQVVRNATQPFVADGSIWQIVLTANDPVRGTVDLQLALNESGAVQTAVVKAGLRIRSTTRI